MIHLFLFDVDGVPVDPIAQNISDLRFEDYGSKIEMLAVLAVSGYVITAR